MDWVGFAAFIGATGTIILGVVVPLLNAQHSEKAKKLEFILNRQDKEIERRFALEEALRKEYNIKTSNTFSHIYEYICNLINTVDADRICIVQPHPHNDRKYISISQEIVQKSHGISSQMRVFQFRKLSEWGSVVELWTNNEFLFFKRIDDIKDIKKLYPEAHRRGCTSVAFCRLSDANGYWLGTLAVDFVRDQATTDVHRLEREIRKAGELIADILPEYVPPYESPI